MEENVSKVDKLLIGVCLLVALAFCLLIVIYYQSSVENKENTETTLEEEILSSIDESTTEPVDESYYEESAEESTSDEESCETAVETSSDESEEIQEDSQESSVDNESSEEETRGTLDLPYEEVDEEVDEDVLEVPKNQNGFKAWMPYTALSKTSKQGRLLALAEPDENGLMKIGEYYCVALGQYYGTEIGQCYEITLSSGLVYKVVLGDCKGKKHTDTKMQYSVGCGCMCEFIVDKELLKNTPAYRSGNISSLGFEGTIVSIVKLQEKIEF